MVRKKASPTGGDHDHRKWPGGGPLERKGRKGPASEKLRSSKGTKEKKKEYDRAKAGSEKSLGVPRRKSGGKGYRGKMKNSRSYSVKQVQKKNGKQEVTQGAEPTGGEKLASKVVRAICPAGGGRGG